MNSRVSPPAFISRQVVEARRFYHDGRAAMAKRFAVVCGGWERCAADYRIRREQFPYLAIEFVAGGKGTVWLGHRRHPLARGSVFAYGGDLRHAITTDPDERLSKYFVNLAGDDALALMRRCRLRPGELQTVEFADEVQAAFEQLLLTGERHTAEAIRMTSLQAEILLLTIAERRVPAEMRARRAFRTFSRCQALIEQRFLEFDTIAAVAEACRVNPAYLSRLFRRFGGRTPYRFLLRLKMNHAAALLEGGHRLVREAADAFGLDPYHFSRVFKRVHGLSPTAFLRHREAGIGAERVG